MGKISPQEFKPPVEPREFISPIKGATDERIEVGVLFVGAGPASLTGAIRLAQLLDEAPQLKEALGEVPIALIEKGRCAGAHLLSGCVVNPFAFRRLFPKLKDEEFPFCDRVRAEEVYLLTCGKEHRIPTPPTMHNRGNFTMSLSRAGRWLAEQAERLGVTILTETTGRNLLIENGVVKGVRTGDKGLDKDGRPMSNFEPGVDITAKVTILGEGNLGHLTTALMERFGLTTANPRTSALGVKEVWEVPRPLERIIHTIGWPLRSGPKFAEFGGSFCYPMGPQSVSIGLVVGLDYADSSLSVHDMLQEMKSHPLFGDILRGGVRAEQGWGAKTVPEGGFYSLPDRLGVPGAMLIGDAAGFVNVSTLKGLHYAMTSGILVAEAIFESMKGGGEPGGAGALDSYERAVRSSFIWSDLYKARNIRHAFQHGFWAGSLMSGLMIATGGRFPGGHFRNEPDCARPVFRGERTYQKPDGKTTFNKLDSVYAAGNASRDNQPNHLRLQTNVPKEVGDAWINMCPAQVYEWAEGLPDSGRVAITPTNCIQCGAISAKGGRLTPPEGGSGPVYSQM